jgi:hypothetical protein
MISFFPSAEQIETLAEPEHNTYTPRAACPSENSTAARDKNLLWATCSIPAIARNGESNGKPDSKDFAAGGRGTGGFLTEPEAVCRTASSGTTLVITLGRKSTRGKILPQVENGVCALPHIAPDPVVLI